MNIEWEDFKTNPPYDAKADEEAGSETDRVYAYFIFQFTHRPNSMNKGPFVSGRASEFYNGIFTDYKSHMRDSPYETDWIEILAWVDRDKVTQALLESFKENEKNGYKVS